MALNATVVWRVRVGGDDLNGAGYDAAVSGAGTDYSQQDSPQVNSPTGACSSTSTTFTDSGAPFTSAMVGNMLAISAGTNALKQHFMITAYTNSSTITLDRTPTTGGAITAATYRIGGAKASPFAAFSTGGAITAPTVTQTNGLAAGHSIYVRGSGSDSPAANDYTTAGYAQFAGGSGAAGMIRWIGENGRPQIGVDGMTMFGGYAVYCTHMKFLSGAGNYGNYGVWNSDGGSVVHDTHFDCAGYDTYAVQTGEVFKCKFTNSGGASTGSYPAVFIQPYGNSVSCCHIDSWRGGGVYLWQAASAKQNLVTNCKVFGIRVQPDQYGHVFQNTIDNCVLNLYGAESQTSWHMLFVGNLLTNGTAGIQFDSGSTALNDRLMPVPPSYNAYYNNTNDVVNISKGATDITLSASPYIGSGDYGLNNTAGGGAACRAASFPGQL